MDHNRFNEIIHQLNRKLFMVAFRMLRNRQEAEDVVQDVFIKLWEMRQNLDNYNDLLALAVTMTRNKCIDKLRKLKFIDNKELNADFPKHDNSPSPFDELVRSENVRILQEIIGRLPQPYRQVIELKEIRGLSYKEISQLYNCNINTLRVNVSRGRQMIKEKYLNYLYERRKTEETTGEVL
ncbi:MAG: RNA polymerase sigma factor [Bacteroidales bacterium]|jgi:RNA polymerase sigma-70 factor (ECF subfamily)